MTLWHHITTDDENQQQREARDDFMNEQPNHTPGEMLADGQTVCILADDGTERLFAKVHVWHSGGAEVGEGEASAARMALCWNSHDALVEALALALPYVTDCEGSSDFKRGVVKRHTQQIREALEKAKGPTP